MDWIRKIKDVPLIKRYAQFSEEEIFQYVFKNIGTTNKFLVDLGAGGLNKGLSNSRWLLEQRWTGVLIDGDNGGNDLINEHFITYENIYDLLKKYKVPTTFDFLSIDIDGNDYWILQEIIETGFKPRVVYLEYNGTLAPDSCVAMKYNPSHTWGEDNYYGASFAAFGKMMNANGYTLIFEIATTNMLFVASNIVPNLNYSISYTPQMYHKQNTTGEWVTV